MRPSSNYKFGSVFVLSQPVTTVDFKFYVAGGTVAQKFKPVIYTVDGSGAPTTLVASGAEVTVAAGQAAGWVTSTLPAVALVPGSYMLALLSGPTDSGAILYYAAVSDTKAGQYNANAYPTASPSWGTTQYENHLNSFYIDYTTTTTTGPPPVNTSLPVISGSAQQGQSLTGSNGAWSNSPSSYGYQWQRCNSSGAACVAIPAAIGNSYLLVADVGATLRFQVTATNGSGPASATSVQTAVVTAAPGSPPVNTSLPVISGTAQQGQLLSGSDGGWSNSPSSTAISGSAATAAAPLVLRSLLRPVTATCWPPPTSAQPCASKSPPPTTAGRPARPRRRRRWLWPGRRVGRRGRSGLC